MHIMEILIVIGLLGGAAALAHAIYGKKDEPTPCIGCGACLHSGKCVMRRREAEKKQENR